MACDYLVAADGARSALRRALGVPLDGQPALQVASCLACLSDPRDAYLLQGPGGPCLRQSAQAVAMRCLLTEGGCQEVLRYYTMHSKFV